MIGLVIWAAGLSVGPPITAASAIAIDFESGRVLCEKAADVPRYPASTTKILTGLLVLERLKPETVITAPSDVEAVGGASLYMKPGERLRARDLLAAILLRSANDACQAVAVQVSGSAAAFAAVMNERARQIGCARTHFTNPHGLHDPRHETTARDLALIAREAMRHREFRRLVAQRRATIDRPANPQDALMVSRNKYLSQDPTADGIKTGWTVPAGKCYVGSATRNGFQVITVVLKSEDWIADHQALLDWCYTHYERKPIARGGAAFGHAPVAGGRPLKVPAVAPRQIWGLVRKGAAVDTRIRLRRNEAPLAIGSVVGRVEFWQDGARVGETPLVAAAPAAERDRPWWPWAALVAGGSTVVLMGRRRRPRRRRYGQ